MGSAAFPAACLSTAPDVRCGASSALRLSAHFGRDHGLLTKSISNSAIARNGFSALLTASISCPRVTSRVYAAAISLENMDKLLPSSSTTVHTKTASTLVLKCENA